MTPISYDQISISISEAESLAYKYYGITGEASILPGELDFNFKIKTSTNETYILKVSRPDVEDEYIDFQEKILQQISHTNPDIIAPKILQNLDGNVLSKTVDIHGKLRLIRLMTWIDGRPWSSVNPISDKLLFDLGFELGKVTFALSTFQHPFAKRIGFEWNIDEVLWIKKHLDLFESEDRTTLTYFLNKYENIKPTIDTLRKSIIHNDCNDNNILVTHDKIEPSVVSIIDYGDAVYSTTINDLAVCIAYAIMDKPDPVAAACQIIKAFHKNLPLLEEELAHLYLMVACRLIISVTKSAINKSQEPENEYLLISEKPAWTLLRKWQNINENFAHYAFRNACGFDAHPNQQIFEKWVAGGQAFGVIDLFHSLSCETVYHMDMSVESTWLGSREEFTDVGLMTYRINKVKQQNPKMILANGYEETRPFYSTEAYKKEGNNGPEYRTVHLGVDFWVDGGTPLFTPLDGTIISIFDNDHDKDYGPTIIIEHDMSNGKSFYTLYGHLSKSSLTLKKAGQKVQKGDQIGYIGFDHENGNWTPHLHFQVMLDMLGNEHDFPGVAFPKEIEIWKSICPNPNLFLKQDALIPRLDVLENDILNFRKNHLGKSLSLSYNNALTIIRGEGSLLIDKTGRKYLDTVNNVAHVGHEHPRVVMAAKQQISLLNTNTRYLHQNINFFAEALLETFPPELCVVHFVNSGSEANELALRMAYNFTNQRDVIAMEVGYHGNTNACIDISSYKFDGKGGNGQPSTTHICPLPDTFRGLYRGENTASKYAKHIEEIIGYLQEIDKKPTAFIHENIISCGGQIELPRDFLRIAYDAVRNVGGLCIADEVQTGCGRIGSHFWAFQVHDVIPDIVTIGKPLGNGHPLAAVVCTKEVADRFANGMEYFNTFGGNPVSCAIGLEVLKVINEEGLQENARVVGNYLKQSLQMLQKEFQIIGDVRGQGLFLGFELNDLALNPLAEQADYLINRMRELGILMSTDGPDHNVIKIKPPMVFDSSNADTLISTLRKVLKEDFMQIEN